MYKKILVPVDGSDTSALGLSEAVKLAKNQGSAIRLVHIVDEYVLDYAYSPGLYATNVIETMRTTGQSVLDKAAAAVKEAGVAVESVLLETIGGPAADLIVAQAKAWPADLIVIGTHGRRGLRRLAMGSDAEQVLRSSPVPVLLVRRADKA
ncbi:MAG TPA: universal stress protein [Steroidobacteraceae bacterium]|nr:universal stress protein [Steroidobacteraceae bacterium]